MTVTPRILLIGTADTKSVELLFLRERIEALGGQVLVMDVGVLQSAQFNPEITNHQVAAAANTTLQAIIHSGDENTAMTAMAQGAVELTRALHRDGKIDGVLALGGTMGTDLALDVAAALPMGVPKVVLSTVAYSHLLPPERIAPDLIMMLWAGGLYGLNSICRTALAQAAGAVVGACQALQNCTTPAKRPIIGITSLGSSNLKYMVRLKPALESRGYEVAVFHTTGMGGHAFETLAAQGHFAAVFDFSLQELANQVAGSCVTAGPTRLQGAGASGTPQLVAPGAVDMVDLQAWKPLPDEYQSLPFHAHNRLIASVATPPQTRRSVARAMKERLALAQGPTCLLLPLHGVENWDREGEALHDPVGLQAFVDEATQAVPANVKLMCINAHINDEVFSTAALQVFDQWVREGKVASGVLAA